MYRSRNLTPQRSRVGELVVPASPDDEPSATLRLYRHAGAAKVICSTCGTENDAGRKFCIECAARLATGCPNCGTSNPPAAKFCGECATPLAGLPVGPHAEAAARQGEPTPAPIAERRLVSVLFADLVGFTPFAEERDAEEVRDTLTRYFDLASDVIARYGGTVEKFIGDAVMAVWGAPTAKEDDPERAVRAALELVDALETLGPSIQARAAVLTGEAAVTIGATNQGMVAGDLVNTASRLQSVAPPGAVLVGEATQRAASRAIVFEEVGEQLLKGKTAPVAAWRALRVVAERGGRNRAQALEAPFVGRDDELRLLKELFHATGREKRTRLVSVIGPAGIGKSRLAWEFLKYVDGLIDTVWWHDGRSPAYGEGITFWALGEMIRGRCGLLETDDESTTRAKIAETLAIHIPDPDERRWIEPALLVLLGIESGIGSEQLFGAWRTFFERLAATGPVVLVFEDFHCADSGLLDFVDHLLEWSKAVPIYVVTLARPEIMDKRPDWGAGKRNFTSLYLEPLPESAMHELLAGLVPGLPQSAATAIVARAGGIPLYAVETVRMLLADDQLRLEGGIYVPTGDLASVAVPKSLTALITARLDGLAPEDRALVHDAAVLGQSFTTAALAAVSGIDENALDSRLRALARQEIFALDADPRSPERGQYAFVQALTREVAYNTLAKKDRKTRHLAAARFFESLDTDELAGALAGHYLAAHQNSPEGPEADALAGQAWIALSAATNRAISLGAYDQAVNFLIQALTVTTDPIEEAKLLERAGDAASAAAHPDQAEDFLRRAIARHRERDDRPATARVTAELGRAYLVTFRTDAALAVLGPAADEFADLEGDPAVVALSGQLARAYFLHAEPVRAIAWADRTLPTAERFDLVELVADTLVTKGSALVNLGRSYEGIGVLRAGLELAEANGLPRTALRARTNLGVFQQALTGPADALATSRDALADARRLGLRSRVIRIVGNAAEIARLTGDWDWAQTELDALMATELEAEGRIRMLSGVLVIHASRGEAIVAELAEFERLLAATTDPMLLASGHDTRGAIALAEGRLAAARTEFRAEVAVDAGSASIAYPFAARPALWAGDIAGAREDLAALDAIGIHGPIVSARRTAIEAGIAALDGHQADALTLYRTALRSLHDLGAVWEEALVGIDMATLLDPAHSEVRAAAESARQIITQLGAKPFLERLDTAMARSTSTDYSAEGVDEVIATRTVAAS